MMPSRLYDLFAFVHEKKLKMEIVKEMLPVIYQEPQMNFNKVLDKIGYKKMKQEVIISKLPEMRIAFREQRKSNNHEAELHWIMGRLRKQALGNIDLRDLFKVVEGGQK